MPSDDCGGRVHRYPGTRVDGRQPRRSDAPTRLLSDNGSSYIAAELADWIDDHDMDHIRGAPYHLMTQGKIERWHQTLKNRILLEHYYLPGDLMA